MHVRASRRRPARRRHGRELIDGGRRIGRAGSLFHRARRTRNSSPLPPRAFAAVQRPVRRGPVLISSPSQEVFVAQPPTPLRRRLLVFSCLLLCSCLPFLSVIVQRTSSGTLDVDLCLHCSFLGPDCRHYVSYRACPSMNCSSSPTILVQPISKFFRAKAGVFGNVSRPLCVIR